MARGRARNGHVIAIWLKEMLATPDPRPIYLIIDGLDESSGLPSPREGVLKLLKDLVGLLLQISTYASRAAQKSIFDMPLSPWRHIKSPFMTKADKRKTSRSTFGLLSTYSDSEQLMKGWKVTDKEDVIKKLSDGADGT
jgi:hypothetical protein